MTVEQGLLVVLVVLVLAVLAGAVLRRSHRRPTEAVRDDSLRAGPGTGLDSSTAAQRGANRNAWMRPGGGSG